MFSFHRNIISHYFNMELYPSSEFPRKPQKTILKKTFDPRPRGEIITNYKKITVNGRIMCFSEGSGRNVFLCFDISHAFIFSYGPP